MADVFTPAKRSRVMAAIRSKGNRTTELRLIDVFRKNKISGWRRNFALFGRPDFVFPKKRVVIFVDGCFWHGCKRCFRMPTSNTQYWVAKIERNRKRDQEVARQLKKGGWKVLRMAECVLENDRLAKLKLVRVLNLK
ncbi:MAG TPA: very short patch repair endonuclease [Candidatus Methylacidiphilales bacterium]|nr:very short patch repair endonuclease [Candidatus Methylacidiphilales bacterium]